MHACGPSGSGPTPCQTQYGKQEIRRAHLGAHGAPHNDVHLARCGVELENVLANVKDLGVTRSQDCLDSVQVHVREERVATYDCTQIIGHLGCAPVECSYSAHIHAVPLQPPS